MASFAVIRDLEQRASAAWPSARSLVLGGWLLRLSDGYTRRANSVSALAPHVPFDAVRPAIEQLFARHSLPPIFRLTPLAPPDVDDRLREAGYELIDPALVMTTAIEPGPMPADVRILNVADPGWIDGFARAALLDDRDRHRHHAIVSTISLPAAFLTVLEDDEPVGFGLGVHDRGSLGIFDVVTVPDRRSRGHARTTTRALLDWGSRLGATNAYLQVGERNAIARRLYASLGFEEAYRYHDRRLPVPFR